MKLYTAMESIEIDNGLMSEKHAIMEEAIKKYLKLKKIGRTHRSVLDMNRQDINEIIAATFPLGECHIKGNCRYYYCRPYHPLF